MKSGIEILRSWRSLSDVGGGKNDWSRRNDKSWTLTKKEFKSNTKLI